MNYGSLLLHTLLALLLFMCLQPPTTADTTQPTNRTLRQQRIQFIPVRRRIAATPSQLPAKYWGDFLGPKDPNHLRIYLQNPNRISAKDDFVDFQYLCQALFSNDVDIFGLSETGLDWKQHGPRSRCRQIMDDFWQHTRLITSTSSIASDTYTQFGGTCTGVTGKWSGRISEQGMDSHGLGRWSYVSITGKNGRQVLITTVYQACKASISTIGSKTAYAQQWHLIRQEGDRMPDPRKRFIQDLDAFLEPHYAKGTEILLIGDFNETLGDSLQGLDSIVDKYGLLDLMPYHHGLDGELETYARGTKRLDYALGTQELAESIVRIGITPYNFVITSDHRGLFIDFDVDAFLGGDPSHLMSPALRGIKSNSPKQCRKYVTAVDKYLKEHKVFERAARLQALTDAHGLTQPLARKWERIDRDLLRACLHAERLTRCRDRPAWSPKLHQASMAVAYWKITLSGMRNNRDFADQLELLLQQLDWDEHPPNAPAKDDIVAKLRDAQKEIRTIRADATEHRSEFLQERAAAEALAGNDEVAKVLRRIEKAEATKVCFRLLRKYLKPSTRGGITRIEVANKDGTTRIVSEPKQVNSLILKRNHAHFSQATGTPFTKAPLSEWLGLCGETEIGCDILNGTSQPDLGRDCPFPETQMILDALQPFDPPAKPVPITVTETDYRKFFRKWTESTSTSPSGKHLGHYKALLSLGLEQDPPIKPLADAVIELQLQLSNVALTYGHVYDRWRKIVSVMIEKKPGLFLLEKLRTIHLFEADYNWLLGLVFGRRMVYGAEEQNHLSNGQWGARPGRSTEQPDVHKTMSYELSRMTRTPLGTLDNDAKACYDRIVMNLALMLCQKHGVPQSACLMVALALVTASYSIKTGFGVSEGTYSSTDAQPTHGPGQGSRLASALWMIISCILFSAMDKICHGASFCDPTNKIIHQRTSDGFVDDVTHWFNLGLRYSLLHNVSFNDIASGLEREGQSWERLLWTTGGKLELTKCLYYILIYKFEPDGTPRMESVTNMGDDLVALTSGQEPIPSRIDHRECSKAHRTLGMWPTPDGSTDTQFAESIAKSKRFAKGVAKAPMTRYEANTAYWTMWLPSITFGLGSTFLTADQLDRIQRPMMNAILPKMGYSSKTSRDVVFGPKKYLGIGCRDLAPERGIQQTLILLKHIRADQELSTLLQIGLEWFQIHAGVGRPILECPDLEIPYLEVGWFRALRYFLCSINASIHLEMVRVPQQLRERDQFLMESFMQLRLFSNKQLYRLNLCRLFLQVECLSEICNTIGDNLLPEIWQGRRSHDSSSTLLWPNQARPFESSWILWRGALKHAYLGDEILRARKARTQLRLKMPLGAWIGDRHRQQRQWASYVNTEGSTLFQNATVGFRIHDSIKGTFRNRRFQISYSSALSDLSTVPIIIPVSVKPGRQSLDISKLPRPATVKDDDIDTKPDTSDSFSDHLDTLADWQRPLLEHLECVQAEKRLHELLSSGIPIVFTLASDGGARDDLGSFGWKIAVGREILWTCMGPTFGLCPGSFRAESYGFISALLFLQAYLQYYETNVGENIRHDFYCDSDSLLKRIQRALNRSWSNPSHCLASDFDLESGILDILSRLSIAFQFLHVKSHQDDATEVHLLPWEAQLNVQADALATDYLDNYADPSKLVPFIPASHASLIIDGETITRRFATRLRQAASSPRLCQRLMTRNAWTPNTFRSINWLVPGKALDTLEHSAQIFIVKLAHDHLPTRRHMRRIGRAESDKCPACLHIVETDWHIFSCPRRSLWREDFLRTLRDTLEIQHTQPDLTQILLQGIRGALSDQHFQMSTTKREPRFRMLVQAQNKIGWQHILKGRFSHHWTQLQGRHILDDPELDPTKKTGDRWLKQVLHHIWTALWRVWLIRNDDLHGRDKDEQERKRMEKLRPHVLALYSKQSLLLACDKSILELPIQERMKLHSRELATWIALVTPTVKRAVADSDTYLRTTNQSITAFLAPARPDPLTTDELVNELRPVSRMRP
jgi:hypothetical protein